MGLEKLVKMNQPNPKKIQFFSMDRVQSNQTQVGLVQITSFSF